MLTFITSVRHPLNSNSYARVVELLDRTLASVCRQTDANFRVIVVCNEIPDIRARERVIFHRVAFPPPTGASSAVTGLDAIRLDRGTKYFVGLIRARELDPGHVMFFDADDYVSNRVAEFVNADPRSHGWVMQDGYIYEDGSHFISELSDFHLWNGSCNIIRYDLLNVPEGIDPEIKQEQISEILHPYFLYGILGAHPFTKAYFDVLGTPLEPFPFRGAIYVTGTGENHSGLSGVSGRKRVDERIIREFGIPRESFNDEPFWLERARNLAMAARGVGGRVLRRLGGETDR